MYREKSNDRQRVLGRVSPDDFVGRSVELRKLLTHADSLKTPQGLLLLLAPSAGVSELLRQAYDELFNRRGNVIPIYFAITRSESTAVSIAIQFLNTFLLQYVVFRRNQPSLIRSGVNLNDLLQMAPPSDLEWMQQLLEAYNRERFGNDDRALVQFCLTAPQRVPSQNGRPFTMFDAVQLPESTTAELSLGDALSYSLTHSNLFFAIAGLRRQILELFQRASPDEERAEILRLEKLSEEDAQKLVEQEARRQNVPITEEIRDLIVQQFDRSPFLMTSLLTAAKERKAVLSSYLECEQVYINELMGGRIHRYFNSIFEGLAPSATVKQALTRLLYETAATSPRSATFESWRKELQLETSECERLFHGLHVQELVNWDGPRIEVLDGPPAWLDYLTARYRLEVKAEPRALVFAEAIASSLKRAPHTMARRYRVKQSFQIQNLLEHFNCQRIPESLLRFDRFRSQYQGKSLEEIGSELDNETEMIRLPQVIQVTESSSFYSQAEAKNEEERSLVAYAFEEGVYTDVNQVVLLVAEVASKLEVPHALAKACCTQLEAFADRYGFKKARIWLISNEGFSDKASKFLEELGAWSSNRQQAELLAARIDEKNLTAGPAAEPDEFTMILPMGDDNELIAASTAEQIARRLKFQPEAINQIKHAIVEACLNATEHSLSPDRKIYQRFRVEDDKLVVTISSRGVVPSNTGFQDETSSAPGSDFSDVLDRRGWGLKLIRTLMDEVEFERVDDGTSLRMTKYRRH